MEGGRSPSAPPPPPLGLGMAAPIGASSQVGSSVGSSAAPPYHPGHPAPLQVHGHHVGHGGHGGFSQQAAGGAGPAGVGSPGPMGMAPPPSFNLAVDALGKRPAGSVAPSITARRTKKPKPTEHQSRLPIKLLAFVPEAQVYQQLTDFEKKLDATLLRKQLDLQETKHIKSLKTVRVLRMFIYNTYENQTAFYHTDDQYHPAAHEPPSWTLRIEGHLLEPDTPTTTPAYATGARPRKKFSRFFKRVFVQLNKDSYAPNDTIEWDRSESGVDTDGFEIKRQGDRESTAHIFLHLDYSPTRFKLSPALARLLDMHTETRTRVTLALWQYIKVHRLQDPEDRRFVINDAALTAIFNCNKMEFANLPRLLNEHLSPPDPIEIEYTIRCSGEAAEYREAYDIEVEVDDNQATKPNLIAAKETGALDEQIAVLVGEIRQHYKRREFMQQFGASPVRTLHSLIAAQVRDYQRLPTDATGGTSVFEEDRYADFYYQPLTLKAIGRLASQRN